MYVTASLQSSHKPAEHSPCVLIGWRIRLTEGPGLGLSPQPQGVSNSRYGVVAFSRQSRRSRGGSRHPKRAMTPYGLGQGHKKPFQRGRLSALSIRNFNKQVLPCLNPSDSSPCGPMLLRLAKHEFGPPQRPPQRPCRSSDDHEDLVMKTFAIRFNSMPKDTSTGLQTIP